MASTFSSALNLELQASGENSGTRGVITNNNLQKVESAIKGYVSIAIASTTDSLATSDGSTQSKHTCLLYTSPSPRDGLLSRMPSSA